MKFYSRKYIYISVYKEYIDAELLLNLVKDNFTNWDEPTEGSFLLLITLQNKNINAFFGSPECIEKVNNQLFETLWREELENGDEDFIETIDIVNATFNKFILDWKINQVQEELRKDWWPSELSYYLPNGVREKLIEEYLNREVKKQKIWLN